VFRRPYIRPGRFDPASLKEVKAIKKQHSFSFGQEFRVFDHSLRYAKLQKALFTTEEYFNKVLIYKSIGLVDIFFSKPLFLTKNEFICMCKPVPSWFIAEHCESCF
jgi:hypothetical protein